MENTIIFLLMLNLSIFTATKATAPPPSSTGSCTDQLILFSPCLSYVASSPNNLTETASTKCCDAFSSNSLCFCYLLRDTHILGFPLNSTRLLSLSSLCLSSPMNTSSLDFLCAESTSLPPLGSVDILQIPDAVTTPGTGSGSSGAGGKMVPRSGGGAGTTFYFPSLNGSTSTLIGDGYCNSFLLSELFVIFFVMLSLLNLNTLYF